MNRRLSLVLILVLVAAMVLPAMASAEVVVTDGPRPAVGKYSHRLIVELTSPPLARVEGVVQIAGGGVKLDLASPAAQTHIQGLRAEQQRFAADMQAAIPAAQVATIVDAQGATIPATYQILLNGLAVDAGRDADVEALARELRALPNVKRVSRDYAHTPDLYASIPLINAPAAWNHPEIGGEENAGRGIKVASVDGGVHKDAPMFNPAGYTYPAGYPKGDPSGTNGKIIVARTYFRPWDPPAPGDENPWPGVAGTSHGTHTASTAAGEKVQASYLGAPPVTLSGVAPKAYVMSYRVFYESITGDPSFYNTEGIKALEDAVADGADVINNSWGGGPYSLGGQYDALDAALINAVNAGVFVSMSAGNAGPGMATSDHPSTDYMVVAASTSGGAYASGRLNVTAPQPVPANLTGMPYGVANFGEPLPLAVIFGPFSYVPAEVVAPANIEGCSPFPAGAFAGKAALIRRGTCNFSVKVLNAQNAGATFAVIYNQPAAGDAIINMGAGIGADDVTIPSILIGNTSGTQLVQWYGMHGANARIAVDTKAFQIGNQPDVIAGFSSRGPGVGNRLKPDITAPGVNILAQGYDPIAEGEARHLGFGQVSGTSMASPHVAGAGALLTQIHPTWSPGWIKSALMTTSRYTGIFTEDGRPAQPLEMGAGRLDLTNAADPGVILDPPSAGFGRVTLGGSDTMTITLTSVADTTETYNVTSLDTRDGYTATKVLAGLTITPTAITLDPGASAQLAISWDTTETSGPGDQQGFVVLKSAGHEAHFPVWMQVGYAPNAELGRVLLIDNDGSTSLEDPDFPDFTGYYTETLEALGITYDVWDADAFAGDESTVPDANYLLQYDALIYQTGNYFYPDATFTVPTPLTQLDMDALTQFANDGGPILAFGQDLAAVVQGDTTDPSFFFATTLGASVVQDGINAGQVFTHTAQLINGLERSPYRDMQFDISARGDGADNQLYVDELESSCSDPVEPDACATTVPLLQYSVLGQREEDGYVALATLERATLERPSVISRNRTLIFGFGLEGVNNDTGFNTREDLLGTALEWAWDTATTATIQVKAVAGRDQTMEFTATVSPEFGENLTYRWDFGDGSDFVDTGASPTATHRYMKGGHYTVRVEVTNELGNTVIGELLVEVPSKLYLPLIAK